MSAGPYECVARQSGTHCLSVSWWAPEGSEWRPFAAPDPEALNICVVNPHGGRLMPRQSDAESYCADCRQWSPEAEWQQDEVYVDDEAVESFIVCPRCGRHWPPFDPPMREVGSDR